VYFRTNELETPVIQITSPNPGDGKSTMTANLAVSIAQTNKRVLMIECDMRRPSQYSIFGFDRDRKGLADVLKRDCSIDDATMACSEIPNLYMIPSGGIPENPAELLALPDFSQFLSVVRDDYDFILIDSPPIAPVSDAAVIASLADRVVLALTLSKNARSAAASAQESLVSHGADLLGLVVSKYGGTNSYGYSYGGYGYDAGKKYEKSGYYTYS
jgi:capsular exopolysaccharide synthesis family protein